MQNKWLNKKNNDKLIIFFSGWGMDEDSVKLEYLDYDFIIFYNYQNSNLNIDLNIFNKYKQIFLIGWSIGVIFSTILKKKIKNITNFIAINGTLKIIDDLYGINVKIFNSTLNNFNKNIAKKFFQNMGCKDFINPQRTINSQLNELKFVKQYFLNNVFVNNFDKILIGEKDIIIPYKNQKRFWINNSCKLLNCGHYIYNIFNNWEEILYV